MGPSPRFTNVEYMITLNGEAGSAIRAAFPEFTLTVSDDTTVLRGRLADQAALHGLLRRLQDLGLEIVEIRRGPGPV